MALRTVLAADIGAESGRVMGVHFDGQRLTAEEIYRFQNVPVDVRGTLHWDILRLWNDIKTGIGKATNAASLGITTWGVDFGFLDRAGHLLGNPVHYRDRRTEGMIEYIETKVSRAEVFGQTGIQVIPINSLNQLASLAKHHDPLFECAASYIMVPDLLYYWLTGVQVNEFTITSTSACYNPLTKTYARDLLDKIGIPSRLFGEVTPPGQILGSYGSLPVVLAPHHDTASAVVGVPTQTPNFAYISSGTWSLLGLELPDPVLNDEALRINVTNEGGYGSTFRLMKNIMGLWLLQDARRSWQAEGQAYTYDQLADMAAQAEPFAALVNPDDNLFLPTGDMPGRIRQFCQRTGQQPPESVAAVARCILESLALKYDYVLGQLIALTGKQVDVLHIVGGGTQNKLLCQMAADATGCKVIAGPIEATALGNAVTQLIALGDLKSVAEGRALIRDSFPLEVYEPRNRESWQAVAPRFKRLVEG